jgi:ketosteroid isomerase-like protein
VFAGGTRHRPGTDRAARALRAEPSARGRGRAGPSAQALPGWRNRRPAERDEDAAAVHRVPGAAVKSGGAQFLPRSLRAYPGEVDSKPTEIAREGLEAWRKGDFETIEEILDPNVEWHATEPGKWDCHGRDDVMQTLRERHEQGFAKGDLQFLEGGEHAVIVVAHPSEIGGPDWPSETATVMQFRNERVVSMQDYRTEAEAIAAVEQR